MIKYWLYVLALSFISPNDLNNFQSSCLENENICLYKAGLLTL